MAKVLESQRGKQKLVYNGYGYYKKNKTTWICDGKTKLRCIAHVKAAEDITDGGDVMEFGVHVHPPNPLKAELVAAKMLVKRKALESTATPTEVVSEVFREVDEAVVPHLPSAGSLKRLVQRYRSDRTENDPSNRPSGLDPNLRPVVIDLYNNGVRLPKSVLLALQARGYPEPPYGVLKNFIAVYKRSLVKNASPGTVGKRTSKAMASPKRKGHKDHQVSSDNTEETIITDSSWNDLDTGVYEESASAVSQILTSATTTPTTYATPTSVGVRSQTSILSTRRLLHVPKIQSALSKGLRTSRLLPAYSLSTSTSESIARTESISLLSQAARLETAAASLSKTLEEANKKKSRWEVFGDYVGKTLESLTPENALFVSRGIQEMLLQIQGDPSTSAVSVNIN